MKGVVQVVSPRQRVLTGALLCVAAYALFSLQDAAMKWLVADYSVFETLLWRSFAVLCVCLALGRGRMWRSAVKSPVRGAMVWRALVSLLAWVLYYTAARDVSLAEMTTLYFSAPVIVTVMAVVLLKEKASPLQWAIVVVGFIGVIIASRPTELGISGAIGMILLAAMLWAYGYILLRQYGQAMPVGEQVLLVNAVFVLILGPLLPWTWSTSSWVQILSMCVVGLVGGAAQYCLFASFTFARATVLAPFEYSGLLWAFLLSWLVWDTAPDTWLLVGAALIAASGVAGVYVAARQGDGA